MTVNPTGDSPGLSPDEKRERIREAVKGEYRSLKLAVAAMVRSRERGLSGDRREQRVDEVLGETVRRALEHPDPYRPDQPVVPWLVGIAKKVISGEARDTANRPRRAELDDATWERMLGVLDPPDGPASARIDAESVLARLSPLARRALRYRFWDGLNGSDLAKALGLPSAEAARTRISRILQSIRDSFAPDAPEVSR